ncbi:MAG TPA: hypothetical protein VFB30_18440, partial [Spirochaetia bacterium]|nr:hypothetical protein [Spirochaetia bacterium]
RITGTSDAASPVRGMGPTLEDQGARCDAPRKLLINIGYHNSSFLSRERMSLSQQSDKFLLQQSRKFLLGSGKLVG